MASTYATLRSASPPTSTRRCSKPSCDKRCADRFHGGDGTGWPPKPSFGLSEAVRSPDALSPPGLSPDFLGFCLLWTPQVFGHHIFPRSILSLRKGLYLHERLSFGSSNQRRCFDTYCNLE